MEQVILVYKTDEHHSYASRDLIGVATDDINAIDICKQQAKKEHETFNEDDLYNLMHIRQTQSYEGEGEFQYEIIDKINELL